MSQNVQKICIYFPVCVCAHTVVCVCVQTHVLVESEIERTGSEKAQSQTTVAMALLSWLPCTIMTTGREIVCKVPGRNKSISFT